MVMHSDGDIKQLENLSENSIWRPPTPSEFPSEHSKEAHVPRSAKREQPRPPVANDSHLEPPPRLDHFPANGARANSADFARNHGRERTELCRTPHTAF
eukprot:6197906-Pleurochrysis_carterae.AAC.1